MCKYRPQTSSLEHTATTVSANGLLYDMMLVPVVGTGVRTVRCKLVIIYCIFDELLDACIAYKNLLLVFTMSCLHLGHDWNYVQNEHMYNVQS